MPPSTDVPRSALHWCRQVTRVNSQTFYLGSLLYPPQQRRAVWAVYAACRDGDARVDDGPQGQDARPALHDWWTQVQGAFAGHSGETPMQQALCWAAQQYPIPLTAFAELREGFLMDVALDRQDFQFGTMRDLRRYCHRVAGVVGLMTAPIGGYRGGPSTLQAALTLGTAMQLTNILRDVGEDLRRGRLYLPQDLLDAHGVNPTSLHEGRVTPEYRALLETLEDCARDHYVRGRQGLPFLNGNARFGVGVAARLYEGILDDLRAHGHDNLNRRACVPRARKLHLTLQELRQADPPPDLCPVSWAERRYGRWQARRRSTAES